MWITLEWKEKDIQYLKENYIYVTPRTLEKEMDFSKEEIKRKAKELGLVKMIIRRTRTDTHAPCPICRSWKPIEDFNANDDAQRKLQDNCRNCEELRRKKNPITEEKRMRYIETSKKNKKIKEMKESPEYQKKMLEASKKKKTETIFITCSQCGEEKMGREFRFKNMKRKAICKECEKYNRDVKKAEKILNGQDY